MRHEGGGGVREVEGEGGMCRNKIGKEAGVI